MLGFEPANLWFMSLELYNKTPWQVSLNGVTFLLNKA